MACQTSSAVQVLDPIRENYDNYLLIDVGSNMVNKKFSRDLESVLQRAKDSGESYCFLLDVNYFVMSNNRYLALRSALKTHCSHCILYCQTLIRILSFLRCSEDYCPLHIT